MGLNTPFALLFRMSLRLMRLVVSQFAMKDIKFNVSC